MVYSSSCWRCWRDHVRQSLVVPGKGGSFNARSLSIKYNNASSRCGVQSVSAAKRKQYRVYSASAIIALSIKPLESYEASTAMLGHDCLRQLICAPSVLLHIRFSATMGGLRRYSSTHVVHCYMIDHNMLFRSSKVLFEVRPRRESRCQGKASIPQSQQRSPDVVPIGQMP